MTFPPLSAEIERAATAIVEAAYKVHKALGPGLLESVYETCLAYEIKRAGFAVARQVRVPIQYDGVKLDDDLRLDLLVAETIVVEVKAKESLLPVYPAQLLTYLRLAAKPLGFLINFNVPVIKQGITRMRL